MTDAAEGQAKEQEAKLDGWDCVACILGISLESGINILSPIREGTGAVNEPRLPI
jgi:hypothetical protein